MISVTKSFSFDSAHFLPDYDGKCKRIHGHRWNIEITVGAQAVNPKTGMIIDFVDLKEMVNERIVNVLDHNLINSITNIPCSKNPTAENLLSWMAFVLMDELHALNKFLKLEKKFALSLIRVRLWETPTSYAEWTK